VTNRAVLKWIGRGQSQDARKIAQDLPGNKQPIGFFAYFFRLARTRSMRQSRRSIVGDAGSSGECD
jgi:hypothetical protein